MSTYDRSDPGCDPIYTDGLQADEPEMTAIEESLYDTQQHLGLLSDQIAELTRRVEAMVTERAHILAVLDSFSRAEISISSLQQVLDLAAELNQRKP